MLIDEEPATKNSSRPTTHWTSASFEGESEEDALARAIAEEQEIDA